MKKLNLSLDDFSTSEQILIVDEEWSMLRLLYNYLSPHYSIVVKKSAIDALRWIHDGNKPLLIISEYQLPYLSGPSFIQIIRDSGLYNEIPVIILSADEGFEQKLRDLSCSVEGIIRKPFNPTKLKNIIQKLIQQYETRISF